MSKSENRVLISIEGINTQTIIIEIIGTSPLICDRFGESRQKQIRDKEQKKGVQPKGKRNPNIEFEESLHKFSNNSKKYGFPSSGIKKAMISGAYRMLGYKDKVGPKTKFKVLGELVEIISDSGPKLREDWGDLPSSGHKTAIYRAEFSDWKMKIPIQYNTKAISVEELVAMLNAAGFGIGLGAWRTECDGNFGAFEVSQTYDFES